MRFLGRHPDIMPGFHGPPTLHPDGSTESLGDHVAVLTWPACTLQTSAGKIWSADSDPYVSGTTIWLQLDVDRGEVRLKVNSRDFGLIHTLPAGFPRPVHPVIQHISRRASLALLPSPPQ